MNRSPASVLLCVAALIGGCGSAGGQNQAAPQQPAAGDSSAWANAQLPDAPPPAAATPVAAATTAAPALTREWLTGRWTVAGDCAVAETLFAFNPDGRYALGAEQGRWTLAGSALTLEVTQTPEDGGTAAGDRHTSEVAVIGPDEAELRTANVPPVRVTRCR